MVGRRDFISGGAALAAMNALPSFGADASARLEATKKWFVEAQYGMMVHWGLYSLLGGEWKGRTMQKPYHIAEWAQQYFRIPNAEYAKLAKAFNPVCFDADEWVQLARDAGMKYIVITSKHHDGFAMFHSHVSSFNIVDATPFGRDPIEELAEACRRHGLRLGLYYSQDLDWHEKDGGGEQMGKTWGGGTAYWVNNWDFPNPAEKDFARYFEGKAIPQVKEILTQYGDICLVWFDIGNTLTEDQAYALYSLVRKLQPGCLVNSRIGGGSRQGTNKRIVCDYTSSGDNEIPRSLSARKGMLYETCATTNDSWGYKPSDQNWKSPETIRRTREHLKSIGANYLLNVGPDGLGRIPAMAAANLLAANR